MNSLLDKAQLDTGSEFGSPGAEPKVGYGSDRQWLASINIKLAAKGEKTHIRHLKHQGPLRVQRPFHPEPKNGQ